MTIHPIVVEPKCRWSVQQTDTAIPKALLLAWLQNAAANWEGVWGLRSATGHFNNQTIMIPTYVCLRYYKDLTVTSQRDSL